MICYKLTHEREHKKQQRMSSDIQKHVLVATDLDGTFGRRTYPSPPSEPTLCISGRTFGHYDSEAKSVALKMPLYIRGTGRQGDSVAAANFKATMISMLGVTHFLENDYLHAAIIREKCPNVHVLMVIYEHIRET